MILLLLLVHIVTIPTPQGYSRTATSEFGSYLRNLSLKKDKTVYLFNGEKKKNQSAQFAVLDVSVGTEDLQQCADAVMRLRAEFLFSSGQYDKIIFYDNNGKAYRFLPPYTHEHLLRYLVNVFRYCNSASLEKQLHPKKITNVEIGDVLIRGGFPGHVVLVVDVAENRNGEKIFMLAQSYMPAQDIHILNGQNGPWYYAKEGNILTPEYSFHSSQLRSFPK